MAFSDNGRKAAYAENTDLLSAQSIITQSKISSRVCQPLTLNQLLLVSDVWRDDDSCVRKGGR